MSSSQLIILGFALTITIGALLLSLPFANVTGKAASLGDAIFTATSAVCVTGLVVQDTCTYWTLFGQAVIICLIQIGGLGVVTMSVALSMLSGKRIGLRQRSVMRDSISCPQIGGIVRLSGFILRATFVIEALGAFAMSFVFCRQLGLAKGIWYSVFHSISAFCNAGFDLMGFNGKFSSLMSFVKEPLINIPIMALIIIGGLGFLSWSDIKANKLQFRYYRMQTKVIISSTVVLILLPAVFLFFLEFSGMPLGQRILASLFQSVTPRTAGFNTVDLAALSQSALVLMIILMLIGGAPGSTAGGLKITTVVALLASMVSVFRKRSHIRLFRRTAADDTVRNASAIMSLYLMLLIAGAMVINRIEGIDFVSCLFETTSAICTVGLTTGITPGLGAMSRAILITLMFCGRVGALTLVFAAVSSRSDQLSQLPTEKLTTG